MNALLEIINELDIEVLRFIRDHLHSLVLDVILGFFTDIGTFGMPWLLINFLLFINKKYRRVAVVMGVSMAMSFVIGDLLLKGITHRERPFVQDVSFIITVMRPPGYSFPSGHASFSFSSAVPLACCFRSNRAICISLIVTALLIALSRAYFYVHYPSDVLCGILLGTLTGLTAYLIARRYKFLGSKNNA